MHSQGEWCPAALLLMAAPLFGCSGGASDPGAPTNAQAPAAITAQPVSGALGTGATTVSGATVSVYSVPLSGTPTLLLHSTTGASGAFSLNIPCASTGADAAVIVLIASGGHTGATGTSNPALKLMSVLGRCGALPKTATVNELTTLAAAYALNEHLAGDGTPQAGAGLALAAATATALVDPASGTFATTLPSAATCSANSATLNCDTIAKLDALASALAGCTSAATADDPACTKLLACATPGATAALDGNCTPVPATVVPIDTLAAAQSIARLPGSVPTAAMLELAGATSRYQPLPAVAPNDWTVSVTYTGGGLSEPTGIAIDASGNAWVANYNNAVTKLGPTGAALSPSGGYTGGGLNESFGIAIDAAGHVWVSNEQSGPVNSGLGCLTELDANGTPLSGETGIAGGGLNFPEAVRADAEGHIWIANFGNSTLSEFDETGASLSPDTGYAGGGLSFPVNLALDGSGNVWIANQGENRISAFATDGTPRSPAGGYDGGGLAVPQGIAVDAEGHVWVSNFYGDSVSEFDANGDALSPAGGFTGGGLSTPGSVAIDGAGHVWIANYRANTISEVTGASAPNSGSPISPSTGYTAAALAEPFALAIDGAGNLWVTNFGNDTVTEFIGVASGVRTPLLGVPQSL